MINIYTIYILLNSSTGSKGSLRSTIKLYEIMLKPRALLNSNSLFGVIGLVQQNAMLWACLLKKPNITVFPSTSHFTCHILEMHATNWADHIISRCISTTTLKETTRQRFIAYYYFCKKYLKWFSEGKKNVISDDVSHHYFGQWNGLTSARRVMAWWIRLSIKLS